MVLPFLPALITGGAALAGSLISSNATKKATQASTAATDRQIALEREQFERTQANLAPYSAAGQPGLDALQGRLGAGAGMYGNTADPTYSQPGYSAPDAFRFTAEDYKASPAYQLQVNEGLNAITSNMATRGALNSGATIKAATNYAQDMALKDFQSERGFAAGQYADDRAFGRGMFESDRGFGRGIYEGDRGYLTNRYDAQTGVASDLARIGQGAAAGVSASGNAMTGAIGGALQNNASNIANAGLVGAANTNNLIGQGLDAYFGRTQMPTSYAPPRPSSSSSWGIGGPMPSSSSWYSGTRF
jgi:hypothetical protein